MKPIIHARTIKGVMHDVQMAEPIVFVDNEARGRSGHMSHAITEFAPGRIIAFNSNCSKFRCLGHSAHGWLEYAVSNDYGATWGERKTWQWSKDVLLDGCITYSAEKAVALPNGDVAVFLLVNTQIAEVSCEPWWYPPQVAIMQPDTNTWGQPYTITNYAGRIYDVMVKDGAVYVLQSCNIAEDGFWNHQPEHCYRLFKSVDNCQTFDEVCVVPFTSQMYLCYGNMTISPKGELICYAYNIEDEVNMAYAVSPDFGTTWTEAGNSYVKQRIRNPQIGRLDGQYILIGRAGQSNHETIHSMVIYTSADGIHWDDGILLGSNERRSCFYSDNLTITLPNGKQRMYVKYSENVLVNSEVEALPRVEIPKGPTDFVPKCQVNGMLTYFETIDKK